MKIFAHRGASKECPENTLSSFRRALELEPDGLELDVRLTKDRIPVICHDLRVNRTSNGKGAIQDLTFEELRRLDFGSWFDSRFAGEQIPALEEVCELVQGKDLLVNIELKPGLNQPQGYEEEILKEIQRFQLEEQVIISSFDHLSVKRMAQLEPRLKTALIFHHNLIDLPGYIDRCGLDLYSIHPHHIYVTEEMVTEAHKRGIQVYTYTVDDPVRAHKLEAMGADGIFTNKPNQK